MLSLTLKRKPFSTNFSLDTRICDGISIKSRERVRKREGKGVCDGGDIENICESIASTLTHNGAKMILYIQTV